MGENNKTISTAIKEQHNKDYRKGYNKGYDEGYKKGMEEGMEEGKKIESHAIGITIERDKRGVHEVRFHRL